jgi:hypothetical protein
MSKPTGRPRGRPKGSKNKNTEQRKKLVKQVAEKIALTLPGAFEGDSHALLMLVYKDPSLPLDIRIDAAKAAIKYETPALQSTELTGKDGSPFVPAAPPILNIQFVSPETEPAEE